MHDFPKAKTNMNTEKKDQISLEKRYKQAWIRPIRMINSKRLFRNRPTHKETSLLAID